MGPFLREYRKRKEESKKPSNKGEAILKTSIREKKTRQERKFVNLGSVIQQKPVSLYPQKTKIKSNQTGYGKARKAVGKKTGVESKMGWRQRVSSSVSILGSGDVAVGEELNRLCPGLIHQWWMWMFKTFFPRFQDAVYGQTLAPFRTAVRWENYRFLFLLLSAAARIGGGFPEGASAGRDSGPTVAVASIAFFTGTPM